MTALNDPPTTEETSRQGRDADAAPCALCGRLEPLTTLCEAGFISASTEARLVRSHPEWRRADGACPACVQEALLEALLEHGEEALHAGVQKSWPLDAEAVFGALPTPLRLHADPRFTGRGVTIAVIDAGFHPHPDLVAPRNRIRAWVDATREPVRALRYGPVELPRWPGWNQGAGSQWHGLMTSTVAAGNGHLSHGLYRGLAPEAELVLIQVADPDGRIGNPAIVRALDWLRWHSDALGVRIASLSLGGDEVPLAYNPVDRAVAALVEKGVAVLVAAGNDGHRRLVPPATAPDALTIGGLDDKSVFDHGARSLWHGNYGASASGVPKPEVVAPSLWVVAPLLPETPVAREAASLFAMRAAGETGVEARLSELKLVTPHYQHVEGTSFATPVVAGIAACLLEADPSLRPRDVREALVATAEVVSGADTERQGAGAVNAGKAVAWARRTAQSTVDPAVAPVRVPNSRASAQ